MEKETPMVPLGELQDAIIKTSNGVKALLQTRLKEDTIAMLIQQSIKPAAHRPTLDQIRDVLRNASRLEEIYLKPVLPSARKA